MSDDTELLKRAESTEEVDVVEVSVEEQLPKPAISENRIRIYSIDAKSILWAFFSRKEKESVLPLPQVEPLPDGFKILRTQLNWETNSLDVLVEHPLFDVVPNGEAVPRAINMNTTWQVYSLKEIP